MKIFNKIFIFSLAAVVCSACLGDLNTKPLNKTDFTSENAIGQYFLMSSSSF